MSALSGWNLLRARQKAGEIEERVWTRFAQRSAGKSLWKWRNLKRGDKRRNARQWLKVSFAVVFFSFCGHRCAADRRRDGMTLGQRMMDTLAPELLLRKPPVPARCWPSPQDGDQSFVLKWQGNPPLDRFLPPRSPKQELRDGAHSDSSETDVRTHHIPVKERILKSFFLRSCSLCCSELVERRQRAGGPGVPLALGTFKICKFILLLVKLTFVSVCWSVLYSHALMLSVNLGSCLALCPGGINLL